MALYPIGYGTRMVTMSQMRAEHENHMEPEFARRLFNWIESRGGAIGIGGGRRTVQPDKPGFAPAGKSFHQDQIFADGTSWYSAVDLVHVNPGQVHRAPAWSEVPRQGSAEAQRWGVHCNVDQGATPESWHMQAVPQDGYDSWLQAGRPRPKANYPIPGKVPDFNPSEDDDMPKAMLISDGQRTFAWNGVAISGVVSDALILYGVANELFSNGEAVQVSAEEIDALLRTE